VGDTSALKYKGRAFRPIPQNWQNHPAFSATPFFSFFVRTNNKGKADDPIKYFAERENQDLGVVKYLRKPVSRLDLSAFPALSRTFVQLP
jgi:hypothetical protein